VSIDEDLNSCVGCGLCLPHCPTFRISGEEALSPRGRISIMRSIESGAVAVDDDVAHFLNTCIQCRGCEPACPSGVPYGRLIEHTKSRLASDRNVGASTVPRWLRAGLRFLPHHRTVLVGSRVLAVARRARLVPRRFDPGPIPIRNGAPLRATSTTPDVWIFTGCVMDAWQRRTHRSTARIVSALGSTFGVSGGACCGALHTHAGLDSREFARATMRSMPGDAPILVNSAGCGAALKEYGHLLDSDEARTFAARVLDFHEWLAPRVGQLPPSPDRPRVVLQDPCHLRHVQRTHGSVRECLAPFAETIEIPDDGLCCGAGGAYALLQPALAGEVRSRKVAAIEAVAGPHAVVASANPGCLQHLAAAGLDVRHPADIIAATLDHASRKATRT
jgi:glycolate oxidase iron-sulfur subunit